MRIAQIWPDLRSNTDLIIACKEVCKAGVFCCAIDLDFLQTESWGESKDDSKGEVDASKYRGVVWEQTWSRVKFVLKAST